MSRALRSIASLVVLAVAIAAAPTAAQETMETHLIQISLLVASKTGPSELADLPANTRQAIEDVRRFLPFKSYRLLDSALMRAHRGARTTLRGSGDREFVVAFTLDGRPIDYTGAPDRKLLDWLREERGIVSVKDGCSGQGFCRSCTVEIDGKLLVDGGMANNLPVSVAREMGADIVIAVDISAPMLEREQLTSVISVTEQRP